MLYITCAFEAEARAIIDYYKLTKKQVNPFALFQNDQMHLLICKMGPHNAKNAIEYFLKTYPPANDDSFLNLGICAGQDTYEIGELVQVRNLQNHLLHYQLHTLPSDIKKVSCYSSSQALDNPSSTDIAEMEALAIYESISMYFKPTKVSFLKVVSDHFKPFKPNKQFIIDLIRGNINAIKEHINQLTGVHHAQ